MMLIRQRFHMNALSFFVQIFKKRKKGIIMEKLTFEQFCEKVKNAVRDFMGGEAEVTLQYVKKNNGVNLTGINIMEKDSHISPTIYLNDAYEIYENKQELGSIVKKIMEVYEENKISKDFDISFFSDYEAVKRKLTFRLINKEMNRDFLKEVPYEEFYDLAIVCYCTVMREDIGSGSILIKNEHLKLWKIKKQELIKDAVTNMPRLFPMELKSMMEMVGELFENSNQEQEFREMAHVPMYVLTNTNRAHGAASMVYENVLKEIAEMWDDDFYILPSSIHEVILLPAKEVTEKDTLSQMVADINSTQVEQEEILANHAYLYSKLTGQIENIPLYI